MVWSSRSEGSLVFVLVHSVLWPLALNTYAGFQGVPETLRMAGRNYGLKGLRYVLQLLVPAALPSILSGLKIGWAFAWRTLIAAELVFGASSGQGGLGWYIFQNRNELYTDKVFAGLAMVIAIGLAVENLGFHTLERLRCGTPRGLQAPTLGPCCAGFSSFSSPWCSSTGSPPGCAAWGWAGCRGIFSSASSGATGSFRWPAPCC